MASSGPAPGPPPTAALGPTPDRGPSITAVLWVEAIIAAIFITLRFISRRMGNSVGFDDWSMLVATLSVVACTGIVTWLSALGGYRHVWQMDPTNIPTVIMGSYIFETVTIIGVFSSKFSVGYLLIRLLPPHLLHMRRTIWFIILFTVSHNIVAMITNWFACRPSKKLWNPQMPGTCWPTDAKLGWMYMGMGLNIAADFLLAVLPAPVVYNLHLSVAKRIRVYLLLSLSLTATICAIFKFMHMKLLLHTEDFGWSSWQLMIWAQSEVFVIIVCGSIAPLKVLFERYLPGVLAGKSTVRSNTGYARSGSGVYYEGSGSSSKCREPFGDGIQLDSRERILKRTDVIISTQSAVN